LKNLIEKSLHKFYYLVTASYRQRNTVLIPVLILILSIVILYFGAEFSLEGSEKVGLKLGMSPLAIGMLLVGFGTSLPEFFVGHIAAARGEIGIALGSLIGSNIANMLLILGICGLFTKIPSGGKPMRNQFIVHFALGFTLWFVLSQSKLDILSASPLIGICFVYLFMLYRDFRNEPPIEANQDIGNIPKLVIKMMAGFGMLYLGGELLVKSGTDLGLMMGIDSYIISAIFIAFGTSFPELVTSLIACFKKKDTELILGNIVGSNLFNCAFILGSLGIYEYPLEGGFHYELVALIGGAGFLVLVSLLGRSFYRASAIFFLGGYAFMVGHWVKIF
tara:strand:- start:15120 stop:16121 length:1002 start_codon:yes stop_codon:yes gene_type:complete